MRMRRSLLGFGGVHFVAVLVVAVAVLYLALRPVAQWQFTWLYLEGVDWPISQLIWWRGWPRQRIAWLPYQFSDPLWFFIPLFVFGVLGSLWYALLGGVCGFVIQSLRSKWRNRRTA